ncbi:hypothetical protein EYF80_062732 [Liparis tanakae]|uniref:Uncharacterized protein n=1 Tax=Liparis tanakae TaxID=230148 RepID=A0A4Z2EEE8_9TELE|nr:hypothetical protein EYF80_062732 [Liparis tanakae]
MFLRGKTSPAMSDAVHWTVLIPEVHLAKYCTSKHALLHISLSSLIPLSPSLTYLQRSCLMNNEEETVAISISISRISPLISAPLASLPSFLETP